MTGTDKARKKNAQYQRMVRAERDRRKQCRTCGKPAAVSQRTGRLTKQCQAHLDTDVRRKEIYILPMQSDDAKARGKFELEYPLSGAVQ